MNAERNEKVTAKLVLSRLAWFLLCSFGILVIYLVVMAPLAPMLAARIDPTDEAARNGRNAAVFIAWAVIYIIPLYIFLFRKDIGLKTEVLRVTENGFDLKTVFRAVYKKIGLLDHIIYGAMSLIVLLAHFVSANFFYFLMIQEAGFYELPIPRVLSFLLAVLCFAAEYALCLAIASRNWDKNRLRRGGSSPDQ